MLFFPPSRWFYTCNNCDCSSMSWTGRLFCKYYSLEANSAWFMHSFPQRCLPVCLAMSVGITALHFFIYLALFNMWLCSLAEHKLKAVSLLTCTQTQSQYELEVKIRAKMSFSTTDGHSNGVIFLIAHPKYTPFYAFTPSRWGGSGWIKLQSVY